MKAYDECGTALVCGHIVINAPGADHHLVRDVNDNGTVNLIGVETDEINRAVPASDLRKVQYRTFDKRLADRLYLEIEAVADYRGTSDSGHIATGNVRRRVDHSYGPIGEPGVSVSRLYGGRDETFMECIVE